MSLSLDFDLRDFILNGIIISVEPEEWPENSTFRLMYEDDKGSRTFVLKNKNINDETVLLIRRIITRNIVVDRVDSDAVDWKNLKLTVDYLGSGISVDYIYPLFLTQKDRIDWFASCESRRTYICRYDPDTEEKLIELKHSDIKQEESPYDVIGKSSHFNYSDPNIFSDDKVNIINKVLTALEGIPNLFVAGGIALALFFANCRDRDQQSVHYNDIDIFAYGPNALAHIIESVKICEELSGKDDFEINMSDPHFSVRTKYSITINITAENNHQIIVPVQFILLKSRNPHEILSRFDLDACAIGFDINDRDRFYGLRRTVNAFKTMTNIIDPTRQSPTYVSRLIKYSDRGFNIAIPGFNVDNLMLNPKILKSMITPQSSINECKESHLSYMKITGLNCLLMSCLMGRNCGKRKESGDYSHVTSKQAFSFVINHEMNYGRLDKIAETDFVVGRVLNEDPEKFRYLIEVGNGSGDYEYRYYKPSNPEIKLMDNDSQDGMIGSIHQVKTSFYGQYYSVEDIVRINIIEML